MNRPIHFEIQAADPEKAAKFYCELFGWEIKEWVMPGVEMKKENRYWLVTTGADDKPGINGGILFRSGETPKPGQTPNAYVCTMGVASLDESVAKAVKLGATVALPKMPVMGIGWLAYCLDLDGNLFGLMQEDKNAK